MRLTSKSEYGLLALIDLACEEEGVPVSARVLAERRDIPQPYLEQLFALLRKAGIIEAKRGAYGGFVLARPAQSVTVLDIVEALEGPLTSGVCDAHTDTGCTNSSCCVAAPVWSTATEVLRREFSSMTLSHLADRQKTLDQSTQDGKKDDR